jgi:predicted CxxxxCH...CXXCH cytochrome family protein
MARVNRGFVVAAALLGTTALMAVGCGQGIPEPVQEQARVPAVQLSIAQADVDPCADPTSATCTPTGAHGNLATFSVHAGFACTTCHYVPGRLAFDPTGPAYAGWTAAKPRPAFDATAKTCSNVACHSMPAGTFSYYRQGGDGEAELVTVNYGGGPPKVTPSWYATGGARCAACHDDPPRNGSDGNNWWHSGTHGGQGPTGVRNQCQFCHPDASSPGNGIGDTITNPSLHRNGAVNVQSAFTSACFACH